MTVDAKGWLKEAKAVYFDNATSRRDYRVQLRGNKSVVLFGTYLFLLIGSAMLMYTSTIHRDQQEIVEAQASLRQFYLDITWLLAGFVSLVAPALTATTVVTERQRRSLDLVFSAPVSPKYFLVGKMMSSFRYTWMLLILALPVTAVCVVLGGASWLDVLLGYVLLSFQALIMTSIGLLLSTLAAKPVGAVIWSYAAGIVYLWITAALGIAMVTSTWGGAVHPDQPFFVALNPFLNQQSVGTYSIILGHDVPNWILVGLFSLFFAKICLLGAGVMLSPRPEREIRSLRLHAIAYFGLFTFYGTVLAAGSLLSEPATSRSWGPHVAGIALFSLMAPLFVVMPSLSCFGVDSERRFWPGGFFSLRQLLNGRPSGGLPFILAFIGTTALAMDAGIHYGNTGGIPISDATIVTWTFYTMAFWSVFWAIGRLTSSFFVGLRAARTMQFASFIFLVLLPLPFIAALSGIGPESTDSSLWNFYPLQPLFAAPPDAEHLAVFWGIGMTVFALMVAASAEINTRAKLARLEQKYDAVFTRA